MENTKKNMFDFMNEGNFRVMKKRGDTSYELHWHEYYEMILYRDCHGVCFLNGIEYPIDGTCMFFLSPKDFHSIHAQNDEKAHSVIVNFYEDLIDPQLSAVLKRSPRILTAPSEFLVLSARELVRRARTRHKKERCWYADVWETHVLASMLAEVAECGEVVASDTPYLHSAIGKAIPYLLTDISQNISLTDISALCGLTPAYFSTLFRREMGMSFTEWINETRLAHAKRLLEENDRSVLDISLACGYNTASHFYRMFHRDTGMSPTEYREQFRKRKSKVYLGRESSEFEKNRRLSVPKKKF